MFCYRTFDMQTDSKQQLETVSKFQLYEYQFAEGTSRDPTGEESGKRRMGLLAQEVKSLIPEAVKETVRIRNTTVYTIVSSVI